MNHTMRCIAVISLLLISGCATLSESECTSADWYQIGLKDGTAGEAIHLFSEHQTSCEKHDISADFDLYGQGRNEGLQSYCTSESGYSEGINGLEYVGVCPEHTEQDFKTAYVEGLRIKLDELAIEYDLMATRSFHHRFRPAKLHGAHRGHRSVRRHSQLRSRLRANINQRLSMQRWIAHWSAP